MSLTPPLLHCACCCENQNTLKYLLSIRDKADKKKLPLRRLRIPRSKNHQKLPRNRQFRNVVLRNLENVCSGYAEHDVRFPSWRCSINWRQCCAFVLPIVNFSNRFPSVILLYDATHDGFRFISLFSMFAEKIMHIGWQLAAFWMVGQIQHAIHSGGPNSIPYWYV